MEARLLRLALLAAIVASTGAKFKTPNFTVDAPTPEFAEQVGKAAEKFRRELAIHWLGHALPKWAEPCPIKVKLDRGAGGVTSFQFDRGEVYGWRMNIQGSPERILDSVLPHEVTHTIFASHFRQPLPRWADEGACTTVEHPSEKALAEKRLLEYLKTGRGIPFSRMFAMKEYPHDVLPLYSQGHSLAEFLIDQKGQRGFIEFLGEGLRDENWVAAVKEHYQFPHLGALQNAWLDWVKAGRPLRADLAKNSPAGNSPPANTLAVNHVETTAPAAVEQVAQAERKPRPEPNLIYRAQSEDPDDSNSRRSTAGNLVPVRREGPTAELRQGRARQAPSQSPTDREGSAGWYAATPPVDAAPNRNSPPATRAAVDEQPSRHVGKVLLEWNRDAASPLLDASLGGRQPLRR